MADFLEKDIIRKKALELRNSLSSDEYKSKSEIITNKVLSSDFFKDATTILSYISYKNEVETKLINQNALKEGKKLAVPRVFGSKMNFFYIDSYDELEVGSFGILEPRINENKKVLIDSICLQEKNEKILMLIPLVACDRLGHRIGYGKGYYDKFLSMNNRYLNINKIGLSFNEQIFDLIPYEEHDIIMDYIIME